MTREEFAERMFTIAREGEKGDTESAHVAADDVLCDLLEELGYGDGVRIFREMQKWYA